MSTRAIMVRHGESVSNADPEMASLPLEEGDQLTARGRDQARRAGGALAELKPTALLSSTMGRAIETAEIIADQIPLPIVELPYITELRESRDYDSMSAAEQKSRRWSVWMQEHGDDPDFSWHGGESFEQVRGRVRRLKDELESEHDGGRPLVITHGIFLRFFLFDSLLGDAFRPDQAGRMWSLRSLNCGVSVFEHGERWHPIDADTPGWTCISWMSRPWDPA
jgi:2,3-bisphosphoglycerate-dependent phosphoglycerate mutase